MPIARHRFPNRRGLQLAAVFERPTEGPMQAQALFAHCFTCGKDIKAAYHISRALSQALIGVLRFDFTGLGESEGHFADTTFSSNVQDLIDAAAYMQTQGLPPALLIGHSLGGAAAIQAAAAIPSVAAVVVIAAPSAPSHVARHLADVRGEIMRHGQATVELAGKRVPLSKPFIEDVTQIRQTKAIARLGCALLVMHSPLDEVVSIDHASRIFATAKHPKSFVSLDRADHLLSNPEDAHYAGRVIAAWAARYILPSDGGLASPATDPAARPS